MDGWILLRTLVQLEHLAVLKNRAMLWQDLLFYLLKQKVAGQLLWKVNSVCYWSWITICLLLKIWLKAMNWQNCIFGTSEIVETVKMSCQQSLKYVLYEIEYLGSHISKFTRKYVVELINQTSLTFCDALSGTPNSLEKLRNVEKVSHLFALSGSIQIACRIALSAISSNY